jgi:hypothetical protein
VKPAPSDALRRCGLPRFDLQEHAALLLAEYGHTSAVPAMLEWLQRKLGRKTGTGSPYILPAAIRLATRHHAHAQVAQVITAHWANLTEDEREWLARIWPDAFSRAGNLDPTHPTPPPTVLQTDVYEDERGPTGDMTGLPTADWWADFQAAHERASRRAKQKSRG